MKRAVLRTAVCAAALGVPLAAVAGCSSILGIDSERFTFVDAAASDGAIDSAPTDGASPGEGEQLAFRTSFEESASLAGWEPVGAQGLGYFPGDGFVRFVGTPGDASFSYLERLVTLPAGHRHLRLSVRARVAVDANGVMQVVSLAAPEATDAGESFGMAFGGTATVDTRGIYFCHRPGTDGVPLGTAPATDAWANIVLRLGVGDAATTLACTRDGLSGTVEAATVLGTSVRLRVGVVWASAPAGADIAEIEAFTSK